MAALHWWSRDLTSGESTRLPVSADQLGFVIRAELVDQASAGTGQSVRVAVHAQNGEELQRFVLSAERPSVEPRSVPGLREEFSLDREADSAAHAVVRLHGFLVTMPPGMNSDEELDMSSPGDDELVQMEYVPEGRFLGGLAPWFAAAGCTAGCMRVAAVEGQEEDADSKQILVLYRYAPFSVSSDGVVVRGRTRAHLLRFMATGDHTARSLAWAGSSLPRLIYPGDFSEQLQELWSNLAAQVSVRPRAARVEVFVDVGILLRRSDYTPERVERMRPSLERMAEQPWPVRFTGMELHLPEPMRRDHDKDEAAVHDDDTEAGERPAKRRRVVAAVEDCPICLQMLEGDDLATWPECGKPHVFHGACLERVLVESKTCPMCRHKLYIEPKL
ncbi:hypothetical protein CFC21_104575 [Triticum aestivum]|uniref:RING-type E3 ubiquitin transferase n=2 Tax=Triticum aestivum TaxID=4565 RepID=A0A9R1N7L6_WHEAT|nr:uncharacterized protein LOC123155635 [Triticum aestivum]KAF7103603.1 hypothetical protein CFC21_104575 [Triticum aestivum]